MAVEIRSPRRRAPYKHGILDTFGSKPLDVRAIGGQEITYVQQSCRGVDDYDVDTCTQNPELKPAPERAIRGLADDVGVPFGLYIALECSTVANSRELNRSRVLERLDNQRELFLSLKFFDVLNNDPDLVVDPIAYTPNCLLGVLQDDHLGLDGFGRAPVIYAPPSVVSAWSESHLLSVVDGRLETVVGSLVVVLPQAGPEQFVFGSDSELDIYLSEPYVLEDEQYASITSENSLITAVEQEALLVHDPCRLTRFSILEC